MINCEQVFHVMLYLTISLIEIIHGIKMYFILFLFISKYDATTICLLISNEKACSIQVYYCKPVTVELECAS